jgi:probable blue pigment (indigoidine) exporter
LEKQFLNTILTGILFSILWASASVAGKFGLFSVEPLVLFNLRFLLAGVILLSYIHTFQNARLPQGIEWKQLTIFGALNTALYLGIFIIALQYITAGITSLAIVLNPLFISIMSSVWIKRKVKSIEWISIILGMIGVGIAAYPLLRGSEVTVKGLSLLGLSMVSYSLGSVYYTTIPWTLPRTSINAWQVFISGILIAPFTILFHTKPNHFDLRFWLSLMWLIIPVSIVAVQLWLRLLKTDAVRASLWLYLCPIFGLTFSTILLDEPFTMYTIIGTVLVLVAVFIGQRKTY